MTEVPNADRPGSGFLASEVVSERAKSVSWRSHSWRLSSGVRSTERSPIRHIPSDSLQSSHLDCLLLILLVEFIQQVRQPHLLQRVVKPVRVFSRAAASKYDMAQFLLSGKRGYKLL